MSETVTEMSTIHSRLEKLEKENRSLKRGGLAALVLLGTAAVMGQAPASKTVEAQRFELKDANAQTRALLETLDGNAQLILYGTQGSKVRGTMMTIGAGPAGSYIFFGDGNSKSQMNLSMIDHSPSLALIDNEGFQTSLRSSNLVLADKEGFQATLGSADLVTTRTGETHRTSTASLVLFGKDKTVLWSAP
jgi:hypothetical protein